MIWLNNNPDRQKRTGLTKQPQKETEQYSEVCFSLFANRTFYVIFLFSLLKKINRLPC